MYTANDPTREMLSAAIQHLQRGQYAAKRLRDLMSTLSSGSMKPLKEEEDGGGFGDGGRRSSPPATAADLVRDVIQSFNSTLMFLNSGGSDEVSQADAPPADCRKGAVKPEESEESCKSSVTGGSRGCYKRRKSSDSRIVVSNNHADDGHQWRKYGQKSILNNNFPRNYFRCTHKIDQGCRATKHVQKLSIEPPMYQTTYYGHHTCRNPVKAPQIILDESNPSDSSIILCFRAEKSPVTTAASGNGTHATNIPFSQPQVTPPNYAKLERTKEDSVSSEYGCFPTPNLTMFSSVTGSDQGEELSSDHSFHGDMDFVIDGIDFGDVLA
ncbi:hypothetical protein SAY86_028649 [Trapa natans]|uniref:WRKY domain-containing protein n=1 Tax=Trapa natans TaxID=22666 RepID=A0AAN7RGL4_TRANT|nr:hypothetical protein SAY86_028649 [Trapa natans]